MIEMFWFNQRHRLQSTVLQLAKSSHAVVTWFAYKPEKWKLSISFEALRGFLLRWVTTIVNEVSFIGLHLVYGSAAQTSLVTTNRA